MAAPTPQTFVLLCALIVPTIGSVNETPGAVISTTPKTRNK